MTLGHKLALIWRSASGVSDRCWVCIRATTELLKHSNLLEVKRILSKTCNVNVEQDAKHQHGRNKDVRVSVQYRGKDHQVHVWEYHFLTV